LRFTPFPNVVRDDFQKKSPEEIEPRLKRFILRAGKLPEVKKANLQGWKAPLHICASCRNACVTNITTRRRVVNRRVVVHGDRA